MYGGSVRCFMEILIRKVENNRATSKSRCRGVECGCCNSGISGKQIKFTFCWNPFGSRRAVICTRCLHSLFLCALCPVPVSSGRVPCVFRMSPLRCVFSVLCSVSCWLLVQFHFQHKVLFYYPEDTNRTLYLTSQITSWTRLAAVVKVGFDNKITFTVALLTPTLRLALLWVSP